MNDCITSHCKPDADGYGKTTRRINGKRRTIPHHRVVYCDANNVTLEDIEGLVVRHTCDNPRCVNPAHLLIGTHADNAADRVARGRSSHYGVHGEASGRCKLTDEQVAAIRAAHVPYSKTAGSGALAKQYGVTPQHICAIVKHRIRRRLSD